MSYGCLPVGDDRADPELVGKSSVDVKVVYQQMHVAETNVYSLVLT